MASTSEGAVNGSDTEDAAGAPLSCRAPERTHVDALLDISEEEFLKELEPHQYHCYSGLEEAVSECSYCKNFYCIVLS